MEAKVQGYILILMGIIGLTIYSLNETYNSLIAGMSI